MPYEKTLKPNYEALRLQHLQLNVKKRARIPHVKSTHPLHVAQQVVDRLLTLEEYRASKHVSVYISMPSGEVDTRAIIHDLLHSGIYALIYGHLWFLRLIPIRQNVLCATLD